VAAGVIGFTVVLAVRGVGQIVDGEPGESGGPLISNRVRTWYRRLLVPFEDHCVRLGIAADALTYAQLVVSVLAGAAFWRGWAFLAGWLTILAGTLDVLDGGVARRNRTAGRRGAFVDSVVDRYAEFATFVGLGAYFRSSWVLLAVATACFGSLMVSYTRARAEALGVELNLGQVQRPERYLILGTGAWLSGLVSHLACSAAGGVTHAVLSATVVLLAGFSLATALQRARIALREIEGTRRP
jgi:CDP-diacylglycerol--glycerol-3-phosphate 3-phosphatidyltransferase